LCFFLFLFFFFVCSLAGWHPLVAVAAPVASRDFFFSGQIPFCLLSMCLTSLNSAGGAKLLLTRGECISRAP
jgi:hypothetical protein